MRTSILSKDQSVSPASYYNIEVVDPNTGASYRAQLGSLPGAGGNGNGSVTSVGLSLPSMFSVSGSPVTESGTLTASLAAQAANKIFGGPTSGADSAPTFRSLVANDIPSLMLSKISDAGTAAGYDIGTSGATIGLLNGDNTHSGTNKFSGKVGIGSGSTTTTYELDVLKAAGAGSILRVGQSGVSNGFTITTDGSTLTYTFLGDMSVSGGINDTAIGADTPSTGAFTTLSASGITSLLGTVSVPAFSSGDRLRVSGATGADAGIQVISGNASVAYLHLGDSDARASGGFQYNHATDVLSVRAANGPRVTIDAAGAAITGTLSASGLATFTANAKVKATSNSTTDYPLTIENLADSLDMGFGAYGMSNRIGTSTNIDYTMDIGGDLIINRAGSLRATVSAAGFDVTGAISATTGVYLSSGAILRLAGSTADQEQISAGTLAGRIDIETRGSVYIWGDSNNNDSVAAYILSVKTGSTAAAGSGSTLFSVQKNGATTVTGTLAVTDGVTLGNSSADSHTIHGDISIGTAASNTATFYCRILGGFGAYTTSGTLDWDDTSNCHPGSGYTLMRSADALNAPPEVSTSSYFQSFNFEYSSKNGSGQITQLAIPYAAGLSNVTSYTGLWIRGRYASTWSTWRRIPILTHTTGALDNTPVGSGGASTGAFTTLTASTSLVVGGASNFLAVSSGGNISLGGATASTVGLYLRKNITGGVTTYGLLQSATVQSDVTSSATGFYSNITTAAASFTLSTLRHFYAVQPAMGAGSAMTSQMGFTADATLVGATNNYGFYGAIAAAAGRWNFFAAGNANNAFAGSTRFGSSVAPTSTVDITGTFAVSGASTFADDVAMPYGIHGDYLAAASSNWAAPIWGLDTSYNGTGTASSFAATSMYGIAWVRGSHTLHSSYIGEGIYLYSSGVLQCGMGTSGIYTDGTLRAVGASTLAAVTCTTLSITEGAVISGTYTPGYTIVSNIDSVTMSTFQYMRVGNVVTVSGSMVLNMTALGNTSIRIELPVPSNITTTNQLAGAGSTQAFGSLRIYGDPTNDECVIEFSTTTTSFDEIVVHFTYLVA